MYYFRILKVSFSLSSSYDREHFQIRVFEYHKMVPCYRHNSTCRSKGGNQTMSIKPAQSMLVYLMQNGGFQDYLGKVYLNSERALSSGNWTSWPKKCREC